MPKVGTGQNAKHLPYTPAGVKKAKEMAKEKGMPLSMHGAPLPAATKGKGKKK